MSDSWKIYCLEEEIKKSERALRDWCGAAIYELELVALGTESEAILVDYDAPYRLGIAACAVKDAQEQAEKIKAAKAELAEIKANPTGAVRL